MSKAEPPPRSKGVVLIVDDDPIVLAVTAERLEGLGYTVHTREEALGTSQWISTNQPDIILLDVNMPALSGTELALLIRRRQTTKKAVIVLYSSLPESELQALARTTGAIGVVHKTSDEKQFIEEFERVVVRRKS